ncbi:jupiter microtubule associated homolog 2 [Hoplias malabaricus]|uniref:jupiter microtubule associated homolog 2 n=1 Tax=Hoplias malabaricus TaxID=27720 RepID=UPI003461CB6B
MTSTNTFQGLDEGSKTSSRVLQPPGGGSSNIFGGYDDNSGASRRPHKMASTIFAPPEESQAGPKRSYPPGGKSSGIFGEAVAPTVQSKTNPPGGVGSNIFGGSESNQPNVKIHPNKPKDNIVLGAASVPNPPAAAPQQKVIEEVKVIVTPQATPTKEEPAAAPTPTPAPAPALAKSAPDAEHSDKNPLEKDHEPHLGPRPRSHNRVLNPPGGKSSVVFY